MKKQLFLVMGILILILIVPAQAIHDVHVQEVSSNYIIWNWSGDITPLTGISIDGVKVTDFDPDTTFFILSDLNPGEAHQIALYTAGDSGTASAKTLGNDTLGSAPLGLWIYALVGVVFLVLGRLARVRFIYLICIIFGLLGIFQLLGTKEVIDSSVWTLSLIAYTILVVSGGAAYLYGGKN